MYDVKGKVLSRRIFFSVLFIIIMVLLSACGGGVVEETADAKPRELQVVFLSPVDAPELWRVAVAGGEALPLTETGGQVYDFAVSHTGEWIAYSADNDAGGQDLWLLELASGEVKN